MTKTQAVQRLFFTGIVAQAALACSTDNPGAAAVNTSDSGSGGSGGSAGSAQDAGGSGGTRNDAGPGADGQAGAPQDGATSDVAVETTPGDGGRDFSTDRGTFFGASRCAQANVQFCEDFESGNLDQWTVTGQPTIDGLQKARGSKALHIKVASNGKAAIETDKIFPEANNTYYGRLFVYFVALPTTVGSQNYAHWTFVAATGDNVSGEIRVSGQMGNSLSHFGVGTDNRTQANGTGDWTNSDNDPTGNAQAVPLNQWLCIEWMHKGDTNETRFYWDGSEHPSLYTSQTMHGGNQNPYILPTFRRVWVGMQQYVAITAQDGGVEQNELFIDEVALDKERIGCVL